MPVVRLEKSTVIKRHWTQSCKKIRIFQKSEKFQGEFEAIWEHGGKRSQADRPEEEPTREVLLGCLAI